MAETPNFGKLLDVAPTEVERPKPIPAGTYLCTVKGLPKFDKSSKKGTEYVEFTLVPVSAGDDVDEDELKEFGGLKDKTIKDTYYITENSVWRLKKFLEDCGLDVDNKKTTLRELIDETPNAQLNVIIKHEFGNDNVSVFARVAGTAPAE